MKRAITVTLIVDGGDNSNVALEEMVARHFNSIGWNVSVSHSYPNDRMTLEYPNVIPLYGYEK